LTDDSSCARLELTLPVSLGISWHSVDERGVYAGFEQHHLARWNIIPGMPGSLLAFTLELLKGERDTRSWL
jgi:hypothetical protein